MSFLRKSASSLIKLYFVKDIAYFYKILFSRTFFYTFTYITLSFFSIFEITKPYIISFIYNMINKLNTGTDNYVLHKQSG